MTRIVARTSLSFTCKSGASKPAISPEVTLRVLRSVTNPKFASLYGMSLLLFFRFAVLILHIVVSGCDATNQTAMGDRLCQFVRVDNKEGILSEVASGADLNAIGTEGYAALHVAVQLGSYDMTELLITSGANVDLQDGPFGNVPLVYAIEGEKEELALLLLDSGADVEAIDSNGVALLHVAAATDNARVVRELVLRGADVNRRSYDDRTPLHFAAWGTNRINALRTLLELGADPNAVQSSTGETPLDVAIKYGSKEKVILIRESPKQS